MSTGYQASSSPSPSSLQWHVAELRPSLPNAQFDQILFDFEVVTVPQESPVLCSAATSTACSWWGRDGIGWRTRSRSLRVEAAALRSDSRHLAEAYTCRPVGSHANSSGTMYSCPVYKTSKRAGVLSTTGRSTMVLYPRHQPALLRRDNWGSLGHWSAESVELLTHLDLRLRLKLFNCSVRFFQSVRTATRRRPVRSPVIQYYAITTVLPILIWIRM